jgi:glycerophosphoryl diester phosphodiesterase
MQLFKRKSEKTQLTFHLLLLSLLFVSCGTTQPVDKILERFHDADSDYVMVVAHRAAHNGFPENSIPAIKQAIDLGVDIIELDVKVTLDSMVVINHDHTIDRTTTGTGNPEEYTWGELQKFKLKMPDGTFTSERLATLEEALNLAKGKAMIDIDLKTANLKPVVDVVKKTGMTDQVLFFDSSFGILKQILILCPEAMVMPRARSYESAEEAIKTFKPPVVHIDESFYTPEVGNLIRLNNARIWINALGTRDKMIRDEHTEEAIQSLLKYNANIIQTDEPERLIPYLKEKGLRN